jgi:hypothetical protein
MKTALAPLLVDVPQPDIPLRRLYSVLQIANQASPNNDAPILAILPFDHPAVVAQSIDFLIERNRLNTAFAVWNRLKCEPYQVRFCRDAALVLTNALLANASHASDHSSVDLSNDAMQVWNRAIDSGVLQQEKAQPGKITDAGFHYDLNGEGFAWSATHAVFTATVPGRRSGDRALQFGFTGDEPEQLPLLSQFVALTPDRVYRFSCEMRVQGTEQVDGLHVQLRTMNGHIADIPLTINGKWHTVTGEFRVPSGATLYQLVIDYERPDGEVRLGNPILLESPHLEIEPMGRSGGHS